MAKIKKNKKIKELATKIVLEIGKTKNNYDAIELIEQILIEAKIYEK